MEKISGSTYLYRRRERRALVRCGSIWAPAWSRQSSATNWSWWPFWLLSSWSLSTDGDWSCWRWWWFAKCLMSRFEEKSAMGNVYDFYETMDAVNGKVQWMVMLRMWCSDTSCQREFASDYEGTNCSTIKVKQHSTRTQSTNSVCIRDQTGPIGSCLVNSLKWSQVDGDGQSIIGAERNVSKPMVERQTPTQGKANGVHNAGWRWPETKTQSVDTKYTKNGFLTLATTVDSDSFCRRCVCGRKLN